MNWKASLWKLAYWGAAAGVYVLAAQPGLESVHDALIALAGAIAMVPVQAPRHVGALK